MNYIFKILCQLGVVSWAIANVTYFHELSNIEIQPPDINNKTDFGFSMGYWTKRRYLVFGAPHHDLNGKVFQRSMDDIFANNTAASTEIDIDIEKLAGDYSRKYAPEQNFCLGASITVGSDFILTCAPLWTTEKLKVRGFPSKIELNFGAYGTCFVVSETNTARVGIIFEQISKRIDIINIERNKQKIFGGSGWSTLVDEKSNVTLMSLSAFSNTIDIGYMQLSSTLRSMTFLDVSKYIPGTLKNFGNFVSGTFFERDVVTYTFSSRPSKMIGVVTFLQKPSKPRGQWVVMDSEKILLLEALKLECGSMFGAALSAADLNSDGFSDLLVGAPAQRRTYHDYNSGALHIFLGGDKKKIKERRSIVAKNPGGYFGSTIATNDIDGDGISEIFVSAPFEDDGYGAVYVLSGLEIEMFVRTSIPSTNITLSSLKQTQRIQNKNYKSFGFSLQPLPDVDGNGFTELAVGAPNSGRVLLYRSIATLNLTLTTEIIDGPVLENEPTCNILVKIDLVYPAKLVNVSGVLMVTMKANDVSFDGNETFEFVIENNQTYYDKIVTLTFINVGKELYMLETNVTLDFDEYLKSKVFDMSKAQISPRSKTSDILRIRPEKKDKNLPILSAIIQWFGSQPYILGSTAKETVTVTFFNKGDEVFDSCAKIVIEGAKVANIDNVELEAPNLYTYRIPNPFRKDKSNTLEITMDMSMQSNLDERLQIKVSLYNDCNKGNSTSEASLKPIQFSLNTNDTNVYSTSRERNITDTIILDSNIKSIPDDHAYTVINNSTVTWKSVKAKISVTKEKFIQDYTISTSKEVKCIKNKNYDTSILFLCDFDLAGQKSLKFIVTLKLDKSLFKGNSIKRDLSTSSVFELILTSNDTKINTTTNIYHYKIDTSFGQNKTLLVAIAVLLAVVLLSLLSYGLYKGGYFKSSVRTKMEEMKTEIRNLSVKRPNTVEYGRNRNSGQELNQQNSEETKTSGEAEEDTVEQKTSEEPLAVEGDTTQDNASTRSISSLK